VALIDICHLVALSLLPTYINLYIYFLHRFTGFAHTLDGNQLYGAEQQMIVRTSIETSKLTSKRTTESTKDRRKEIRRVWGY